MQLQKVNRYLQENYTFFTVQFLLTVAIMLFTTETKSITEYVDIEIIYSLVLTLKMA